ncbi:MAG: hypothetical protein J6M06_02705 [Synergistaceae bacterium]|nr:hypothetical protein [Synergistaceae bacterium]
MNYSIELTRNNVTPAKFFAEIRFACKKKGLDFGLDFDEFVSPSRLCNIWYVVKDGKKICHAGDYCYVEDAESAPCQSEVCRDLPYDYQAYILNFDGSCFNEICEFTFDDEKTGHGYYYQMNRDTVSA